jgi:hypothetical protein
MLVVDASCTAAQPLLRPVRQGIAAVPHERHTDCSKFLATSATQRCIERYITDQARIAWFSHDLVKNGGVFHGNYDYEGETPR